MNTSRRRTRGEVLALLEERSTRDATGCQLWAGSITNVGYGRLSWIDDTGATQRGAHRVAYVAAVGPIPEGMVIDHLCRVRHCIRIDHLEVVTSRENVRRSPIALGALNARKTHCPDGHPYTPENTYVQRSGGRLCLTCQRKPRNRSRRSVGVS